MRRAHFYLRHLDHHPGRASIVGRGVSGAGSAGDRQGSLIGESPRRLEGTGGTLQSSGDDVGSRRDHRMIDALNVPAEGLGVPAV